MYILKLLLLDLLPSTKIHNQQRLKLNRLLHTSIFPSRSSPFSITSNIFLMTHMTLKKERMSLTQYMLSQHGSDKYGKVILGRFDTGLVNYKDGGMTGVKGHCVGRVCCIFILPPDALICWFSHLGHVPLKYLLDYVI